MKKKASDVVREIVKKPAPATSFGKDPNEPWSTKANIAENITSQRAGTLAQFLKAKGYNPRFITKDKKDSFAKTGEFLKWKRDHGIYEDSELDEEEKFTMNVAPEAVRSLTHDSPTQKRERQIHHAELAGRVKTKKPTSTQPAGTPMTGTPMNASQSFSRIDMTEDNFADPKAATQAPFDMASCPNDVAPESKKKSRASSIVKEVHRKLKEDLYDSEKDQKDRPEGKKPNKMRADGVNDIGDDKPNARYILKGGTTMTGENRNEIEIDPMMNKREKVTDYTDLSKNKQK